MSHPYISRIEITNFRNFAEFEVDLEPHAVFVGENRCGKSNLLHALRLVLDPALPDAQRTLRAEDFWDGLGSPFNGQKIIIKVFIRGFEDDESVRATLAGCLSSESPLTASLTYEFRPIDSIDAGESAATEEDYEFVVYGGANDTHDIGRKVRQWLSLSVLPAERDVEGKLYSSRSSPLRKLLARTRPELDAERLSDVRDQLDLAASGLLEEKPLQDLQARVNARISEIVGPLHAVKTKFDFASSDPEQLVRGLRLFLEEEQVRGLEDASLGTLNIIFLTLLLQELDERRDARALAGMVVAIEEPEAHLHPHIQRLLFRYALRREHSLVIATHSPHIASISPLRTLIALRPNSAGTVAKRISSELSTQDIIDLERYFDVTRAEMLFSKGIIFVEGPAELYLIPAFAEHVLAEMHGGHSLDEYGVSICSVGGTDFAPYWKATHDNSWDIPRVVVTDGDPNDPDPDGDDSNAYSRGLVRGARLIGNKSLVDNAKSGLKDDDTRMFVNLTGVFVGTDELELDLTESLAKEMIEAYGEFKGKVATQRFKSAIGKFSKGDIFTGANIISRIEEIGKGRYAQRLSSKVTSSHAPPKYIKDAITRKVELVKSHG